MITLRSPWKFILTTLLFSTISLQSSHAEPLPNLLKDGDFENTELEQSNFSPSDEESLNQWLARRNWKVIRNSAESPQTFVQHQAGSALLFQGISAENLAPGTTLTLSFDARFEADRSWSTVSVYGLREGDYINQQGLQFSRTGDTLLYDKYTEGRPRKSWQSHTYSLTLKNQYKALVIVFHTAGRGGEQKRAIDNVVLMPEEVYGLNDHSLTSVFEKLVSQFNLG